MKVTLAIFTTLAVCGMAAPIAEAEANPVPWCTRIGSPCGKREAVPEPEAKAEANPVPWCTRIGSPCGKKREAAPEPEPLPWCTRIGTPCGKKREAQPEPEAGPEAAPWCTRIGSPCGKKRDVFESHFDAAKRDSLDGKLKRAAYAIAQEIHTPESILAREPSPEALISHLPGGSSYIAKRGISELASMISLASRDAGAVLEEFQLKRNLGPDTDVDSIKREALPDNWQAMDKRSCSVPSERGHICYQAKRAAEAVLSVIGDTHEIKREAGPEPWCTRVGTACGRKNKRELLSIANAARDLLDSLES